jgi:hypothetical protein
MVADITPDLRHGFQYQRCVFVLVITNEFLLGYSRLTPDKGDSFNHIIKLLYFCVANGAMGDFEQILPRRCNPHPAA